MTPKTPEEELARYKRHLKSEQDAWKRIMDRFCKAMGDWEGPWDNAVEARLKEHSANSKP